MKFSHKYVNTRDIFFTIGKEEQSGKYYISIPIAGVMDYEKYYEISKDMYDRCPSNLSDLEKLAKDCRNKLMENYLFHPLK